MTAYATESPIRPSAGARRAVPVPPASARPSTLPQLAARRRSEPWPVSAVGQVSAATALAAVGIAVGWYLAGGTTDLDAQQGWTMLAVGAAALGALAQGAFLLHAMAGVRRRRYAVMIDVSALADRYDTGAVAVPDEAVDLRDRLAAVGMTHFHRPSCPMVSGKETPLHGSADEHEAQGRVPCGVCAA